MCDTNTDLIGVGKVYKMEEYLSQIIINDVLITLADNNTNFKFKLKFKVNMSFV